MQAGEFLELCSSSIPFSLQDQIPSYFQVKFLVSDSFRIRKGNIEVNKSCIQGPEKKVETKCERWSVEYHSRSGTGQQYLHSHVKIVIIDSNRDLEPLLMVLAKLC